MIYRIAADAVVLLHLGFIFFVVLGGLLVFWRRWVALLHLPAVGWAVFLELTGAICPLTPLENSLRRLAGAQGYEGGFIEHYLVPIIYPAGLTRGMQFLIAVFVIAINLTIYTTLLVHHARRQ